MEPEYALPFWKDQFSLSETKQKRNARTNATFVAWVALRNDNGRYRCSVLYGSHSNGFRKTIFITRLSMHTFLLKSAPFCAHAAKRHVLRKVGNHLIRSDKRHLFRYALERTLEISLNMIGGFCSSYRYRISLYDGSLPWHSSQMPIQMTESFDLNYPMASIRLHDKETSRAIR